VGYFITWLSLSKNVVKNVFWPIFSQTHPVTLTAGWPFEG
jgi:hypothetical protein